MYANQFKKFQKYLLFSAIPIGAYLYSSSYQKINQEQFLQLLQNKEISQMEIQSTDKSPKVIVNNKYKCIIPNVNTVLDYLGEQELQVDIIFKSQKNYQEGLEFILSTTIFGFLVYILLKKKQQSSGMFDFMPVTTSQAKQFVFTKETNVNFDSIKGYKIQKQEIQEVIDYYVNKQKYKEIGAKPIRGILMTGPPGTGKTYIARACAGENKFNYLYTSGSEFQQMFVGVGPKRVRNLFQQAKLKQPCIIFIDEIDALGGKRSGHTEEDNTLNELLVQMDGFNSLQEVIIIAATNRVDMLDDALLRPGRFDRIIQIDLPTIKDRELIFKHYLKRIQHNLPDSYEKRLASLTPGFSSAQIKNIVNEAAIQAVRENRNKSNEMDFEKATERVIAGVEKKQGDKDEIWKVAIHEAGHAVVGWFIENGDILLKLTVTPRSKGALGFAQYLPQESDLKTKSQLIAQIKTLLGGRLAEEHFFNVISTGAHNDLQKVYKTMYNMTINYGMNENMGVVQHQNTQYQKLYSDTTNRRFDVQIENSIRQQTEETREIIKKYEKEIQLLAERVMEKKTIGLKDIIEVLGERPFQQSQQYQDYINAL